MKKILSTVIALVLALAAFGGFVQRSSAETVDQDKTKETATEISFNASNNEVFQYEANANSTFETEKDVDFYRFTLNQDGLIQVNISQLQNAGIAVDLYTSKDELLESWVSEKGNEDVPMLYQGLPAGTYYVKLSIDNGTVTNAEYRMKVLYLQDNYVEKETNNTLATANPMTLGKEYVGFSDYDTVDYYRIDTKSNGKLTVKGTYSSNITLYYTLLDAKGEVVDDGYLDPKDSEEFKNIYTVGVKPGTYYLEVSQDDENYANEYYSTQVNFVADNYSELENNDTTSNATPIQLKRTYNGVMSWKLDVDTFKMYVPANANISFLLSQAPSTSFKVEVVDSKNKTIKTFTTKAGKASLASLGNMNLVKGTYTIRVKYNSGSFAEVPYKLQLQPKIYWGKVEYKPAITGKVVAVSATKVYKVKSGKLVYVKAVSKGSELAVFGSDKYGYKLGTGLYMKKDRTVKYYAVPSQIKSSYTLVNR